MNALTQNIGPVESPKASTAEFEDVETRANRLAADREAQAAVEGLRRLAQEKAAAKAAEDKRKAA
jgi:hypothetical protein